MATKLRVIKVPDLGEGIAEVELVEWHVKAGDTVVEDQALADVMTDKASVEIPSPVAGRVLALGGTVGQMMAVGSELIRIEDTGTIDEALHESPGTAGSAFSVVPTAGHGPVTKKDPVAPAPPGAPEAAVPPAPATAAPLRPTSSPPSAVSDRPHQPPPVTERPIAAPAVRRRAWELGIDLGSVAASGSAGRITHADLDAHVALHGLPAPPAAPSATAAHAASAAAAPGIERNDEQALPVIGLRRRIALQMQESKRRIPHFSYVEEVDVSQIEELRAVFNAKWAAARGRLTLLPLLMRAMVLAVREFPQINARFDDEAGVVTRHGAVHLGIATQTPHGLMVPVVRHAEARDLWAVSAEVARLAGVARAGRATRDELAGSTITISSLGALGGIVSTPVINRPEVAIVAVNRIVERPVMHRGTVVTRQMMNLSSSFDHRVVDGMDAAQFVQALRGLIEQPALLFAA